MPCRKHHINIFLVGGFNPFEKYWSNWKSSPNRDENKKYLKPPPSIWSFLLQSILKKRESGIRVTRFYHLESHSDSLRLAGREKPVTPNETVGFHPKPRNRSSSPPFFNPNLGKFLDLGESCWSKKNLLSELPIFLSVEERDPKILGSQIIIHFCWMYAHLLSSNRNLLKFIQGVRFTYFEKFLEFGAEKWAPPMQTTNISLAFHTAQRSWRLSPRESGTCPQWNPRHFDLARCDTLPKFNIDQLME